MGALFQQSTNVVAALVAALGLSLMIWALTGGRSGRSRRVAERLRQLQGEERGFTGFAEMPLLDRLFRRPLEDAGRGIAAAMGDVDRDATLLMRAGYPPPFRTLSDFYGWKVILAILFLTGGIVSAAVNDAPYMLPVALAGGVLGLYLPDIHLRNKARQRQELFRTSMAFSMDHVGMMVEAGETAEGAIRHLAANGRGLFARKMQEVVADLNLGIPLVEALEKIALEFPLEEYRLFINAVALNFNLGTPLATTLAQQGENIMSDLESELLARGTRAIVPMTMGLAIGVVGFMALVGIPMVSQFSGW